MTNAITNHVHICVGDILVRVPLSVSKVLGLAHTVVFGSSSHLAASHAHQSAGSCLVVGTWRGAMPKLQPTGQAALRLPVVLTQAAVDARLGVGAVSPDGH